MANRRRPSTNTNSTEVPQEDTVTATQVEPEVEEATEAATEASTTEAEKEEVVVDLTDFEKAVAEAVKTADSERGEPTEEGIAGVVAAYQALPGQKGKAAGRKHLSDSLMEQMDEQNIVTARTYMRLTKELKAAPSSGGKRASTPADPTDAFVNQAVALSLASHLLKSNVPENVAEDWTNRANDAYKSSVSDGERYFAWLNADEESRGEEPEVSALVKAAAKLASGKAARVTGGRGGGQTYDGPRRNVMAHIANAFADQPVGTFLKVSQIREIKSEEYGDDLPSPGAISSRLKNPNFKLDGVEVAEEDGKLGARKVA